MQKATRNTFTQKGAEVQKIDQGGIWAYIDSSYENPHFDEACNDFDKKDGDDTIISVARWVYKCRRLLRKSKHIIVSIDNGEILEPCYFVEPSSEVRLPDETLVWLEPLPQLNGYLLIPGGLSQCSGYSFYGSNYKGYTYDSANCYDIAKCLCVMKDGEGRVVGLFVRSSYGVLTEIEDCDVGSGSEIGSGYPGGGSGFWGGGGGGGGAPGRGDGGDEGGDNGDGGDGGPGGDDGGGSDDGEGGGDSGGDTGGGDEGGENIGSSDNGEGYWEEHGVWVDSVDTGVSYGYNDYSGYGVRCNNNFIIAGCCPQSNSDYWLEYDFTVFGNRYLGISQLVKWVQGEDGVYIVFSGEIEGGLTFAVWSRCSNGDYNFYASLIQGSVSCSVSTLDADYVIVGDPNNPTIYFIVKAGHPCLSGSFVLRPA